MRRGVLIKHSDQDPLAPPLLLRLYITKGELGSASVQTAMDQKKFAREREVYKALPLSIRWLRRRRRKKRSGIWRLMPEKRRRIEEGRKGLIEVTTLLSLRRRPRAREDRLSLRKEPSFFKEAAFSWLALFARQSSPEKTSYGGTNPFNLNNAALQQSSTFVPFLHLWWAR